TRPAVRTRKNDLHRRVLTIHGPEILEGGNTGDTTAHARPAHPDLGHRPRAAYESPGTDVRWAVTVWRAGVGIPTEVAVPAGRLSTSLASSWRAAARRTASVATSRAELANSAKPAASSACACSATSPSRMATICVSISLRNAAARRNIRAECSWVWAL